MIFWYSLLVLAAWGVAWWIASAWLAPLIDLRRSLREIASGAVRPVLFARGARSLRGIASDLDSIAGRLRELDRQVADEGFSLRAILAGMVEGVLIVDEGRKIRLVNPALHGMFQLQSSPINRSVMEVFHHAGLQDAVASAFDNRPPRRQIITVYDVRSAAAPLRSFEVSVAALAPEGSSRPLGAIAVFHDLTELKALEATRQELLANVSHELRTPVSILKGYIETLLDGAIDQPDLARRFLGVMQKHGERLSLLLDDLMTISRLESRTAGLKFEPLRIEECVRRVVERLDPEIQKHGARLDIDFPAGAPLVEADSHRIDQVFFNLLDNALKYATPLATGIAVRGTFTSTNATVVVSDNGPGIPLEDQPRIFDRFYRVHKDRSREAGGTGLGLSIVKHVVQAHGGTVSLESAPGAGSAFAITLPLRQPEAGEDAGQRPEI